ncbi:hypothetical protein KKH27_11815 [bacterium]|nr:hypothetical protein [bacterium]MBU1983832.1 hypothetical protein [bacterium]
MIRPLEHHERLHPTEYVNRVKQTEATHSSSSRDFSYEIEEASRESKGREHPGRELGEDTYEPSENESPPSKEEPVPVKDEPPPPDDGSLDIVV